MNTEIGQEAAQFHSVIICFEFSVQCICSVEACFEAKLLCFWSKLKTGADWCVPFTQQGLYYGQALYMNFRRRKLLLSSRLSNCPYILQRECSLLIGDFTFTIPTTFK
jgi:hypothetical protein